MANNNEKCVICGAPLGIHKHPDNKCPVGGVEAAPDKQQLWAETSFLGVTERHNQIDLLERYSLWLEEQGYLDTDWRAEKPYAIDEFIKTLKHL